MRLTLIILSFLLFGCNVARAPIPSTDAEIESIPSVGQAKVINLGDHILMERYITKTNTFSVVKDYSASIPGSLGLPFTFEIRECKLIPTGVIENGVLYRAPAGKFGAHHGLLGNVVNEDDEVGIIVPRNINELIWYVDNSRYNGWGRGGAHWSRKMTKDEMELIKPLVITVPREEIGYRYIQLLSCNWPNIKLKYSERWDNGNKLDESVIDISASTDVVHLKEFEFKFERISDSQIKSVRLK